MNKASKSSLEAALFSSSYLKYKDIQVACIVLADEVSGNNFRNIAEIVDDSDVNTGKTYSLDVSTLSVSNDKDVVTTLNSDFFNVNNVSRI